MLVSDILQVLADENDLQLSDAKTKRKLLVWMNTVYRQVISAADYPWRKRTYSIVVSAPSTGTAQVTRGTTTWKPNTYTGVMWGADHGFVTFGDDLNIYEMRAWNAILSVIRQNYKGSTDADAAFTLYQPRYKLEDGIREDWVIGVYDEKNQRNIQRIIPADKSWYTKYGVKNTGTPLYYYMEGSHQIGAASDKKTSLLVLSPCPDEELTYRVETLLGPSVLEEETTNTLIPDEYEIDLFRYGVSMLFAVNKRDTEAMKSYGALFQMVLKAMKGDAQTNPGADRRVTGYIRRDGGDIDPDLPVEWEINDY